jgi:hypothetical protein
MRGLAKGNETGVILQTVDTKTIQESLGKYLRLLSPFFNHNILILPIKTLGSMPLNI